MAWYRRPCISMLARFATGKAAAPAARLTLASNLKETKKFSMFSQVMRRNSSTLASFASEEIIMKKEILNAESFKYKSLYLCFEQTICNGTKAHAIYSLRLSHLLAPSVHGADDLILQKVAYRCGPETIVPVHVNTGVVGSKIIFCGGQLLPEEYLDTHSHMVQYSPSKEVCVFETDPSIDPDSKLQPSQLFKISRADPVLLEVGYKLYCFSSSCDYESFEVFEPMQDNWLPLAVPHRKDRWCSFSHAIAGRKILLWGRNQTEVNMFDTIHPDKGWTELDSCVGDYIFDSVDGYDQLFVEMKYGDVKGFLMFSINLDQPYKVLASYMSQTFDFLKPMEPLQLPGERPPKLEIPCRSLFFHLGGQKVGLVLSYDSLLDFHIGRHYEGENENGVEDNKDNCHNVNNEGPDDSEKARVLVIVFEYEIKESMDIKYKLLCSRCLEYSTKNHGEEIDFSKLIGAYVL